MYKEKNLATKLWELSVCLYSGSNRLFSPVNSATMKVFERVQISLGPSRSLLVVNWQRNKCEGADKAQRLSSWQILGVYILMFIARLEFSHLQVQRVSARLNQIETYHL